MDSQHAPRRRRWGILAVAGSVLAIAVGLPVGGALAGDGGSRSGDRAHPGASSPTLAIQEQRPDDRQQPDGSRECPEKNGGTEGGSGQQPTPDVQSQEV